MFAGLGSAVEELIFSQKETACLSKKGFSEFVAQAKPESIYKKYKMTGDEIAKTAADMCGSDI